ncbi:MAG: DNA-binding transcriptional repressor PuuR [Pelotomaculum sp. PtaU1.Bin065]|nr:MAG: DNA-binding transcriptional repressor PuuR [Pelotomaculum sp. PtaU1.Bin065]
MIGKTLRDLRRKKGLSLRRLARETDLSHGFICDIEHGRCKPSIATLIVLANYFEVKPEFFLNTTVVNSDHKPELTGTDGQ